MAVRIDWFGEGDETSDLIDIYRTIPTKELQWMRSDLRGELIGDTWTEEMTRECVRRLSAVDAVLDERGAARVKRGDRGLEATLPDEVRQIVSYMGFRARETRTRPVSDYMPPIHKVHIGRREHVRYTLACNEADTFGRGRYS